MTSSPIEPTAPRIATLPLSDLSWERFEQFCYDLVQGLTGMRPQTVHRYGTQGQAQGGIDLSGEGEDGRLWVFSIKRYKKYQPHHVQKHIGETTYRADCKVILISGVAAAAVRDEIRNNPGWEMWDVEDLSQKLRLHTAPEIAKRIIDHHFGPRLRRAFLGLPAVGAFVPAHDFFNFFLTRTRLFHHGFPLVGRTQVVAELMQFAESAEKRIAILSGRGGIGKTRLLREFAERYDTAHPECALRLLNEGMPITSESLDDLPDARCVIIVDDAHRIPDLGVLGAWLREHPQSKLLLGTRLLGLEFLDSHLSRAGFDPTEIVKFSPLGELAKQEVQELARHVLGFNNEHLISRLAAASRDCPLVTVVGGRLLAQRSVAPEVLERDSDFRQVVLNRFRDEFLGKIGDILPQEFCRRLLEVVAALNPIPAAGSDFHSRLAYFLGNSESNVIRCLSEFERVGLLLRRGRLLRVTPDVLADHVLSAACLTDSDQPTRFADEIFNEFGFDFLSSLMRNLSELDWRIRKATASETTLLDNIWGKIRQQFRQGGHRDRAYLLKMLSECALFVPKRVLALTQEAVYSPAPQEPEVFFSGLLSYSQSSVLESIPHLLRRCAYTQSCLAGCLELLWKLGRDTPVGDMKTLPEESLRVLKDIVKYEPDKPISVSYALVDAARRWLERSDAFQGPYSPLDVLDELMVKVGERSWADSHRIHTQAFLVNPAAVVTLRQEVLSLLEQCLRNADLRIVQRAIKSLGIALRDPYPRFNLSINVTTLEGWEQDQLAILEILSQMVVNDHPPKILIEVISVVRHFAHHGHLVLVKKKARDIIASIEPAFDLRLTRVLLPESWYWEDFAKSDEDESIGTGDGLQRQQQALLEPLAKEFWQRFPTSSKAIAELDRLLAALRPLAEKCTATTLVWWLLHARPSASFDFAKELLQYPESAVAECFQIPLMYLRDTSHERFHDLTYRGLATGSLTLRRSIGRFFRWDLRLNAVLLKGDLILIEQLLADGDTEVRLGGISALKWLGRLQPRVALDRALAIKLDGDTETAAELCQFADSTSGGIPDSFTTDDWTSFLRRLERLRRVDHRVAEFLKTARRHVPNEVIGFLLRRIIERCGETYEARREFPFSTELGIIFDDFPAKDSELHALFDAAFVNPNVGGADFAELFKAASHDYCESSLRILEERLMSSDSDHLLSGLRLLEEAPNTFPFDYPGLTERLLERSADFGEECFLEVESQFIAITTHGTRTSIPGRPCHEDIDVRDRCKLALSQAKIGHRLIQLYERILATVESSIRETLLDSASER